MKRGKNWTVKPIQRGIVKDAEVLKMKDNTDPGKSVLSLTC